MSNEHDGFSRRELMGMLAGGVASGFRLPRPAAIPHFVDLDHIDLFVSDIDGSVHFFQRMFGMTVSQPNGKWDVVGLLQFGAAPAGAADTRLDRISTRVSPDAQGLRPVSDSDHITTEFSGPGWLDNGSGRLYRCLRF
jgi:hypothetical protein